MANLNFNISEDNTDKILHELRGVSEKALEIIGLKAERYAKALCPVGTPESTGKKGYRGGTLRNSITHNAISEGDIHAVEIGSNVEYAPYVELGTGPQFEAPPEWEQFEAKQGHGHGKGIRPRHFLRDAIMDHMDEFKTVLKTELGG